MSYTNTVRVGEILLKRGNAASAASYVGPMGEVIVDESTWSLRVQDGATPGGFRVVGVSELGNVAANVATISSIVSAGILVTNTAYTQPAAQSQVTVIFGSSHLVYPGAGVVISSSVYQVGALVSAGDGLTEFTLTNLALPGGQPPGAVIPTGTPVLPLGFAIDTQGNVAGFSGPGLAPVGTWKHSQYTTPVTVAYAPTVTLDVSASNAFRMGPITGDVFLTNPVNLQDGMAWDILIYQDNLGGHSVTLDTLYKQSGGGPFDGIDPTANSINRISCKYWAQEGFIEYVVAVSIS